MSEHVVFEVYVTAVERGEPGTGRIHLATRLPSSVEAGTVRNSMGQLFARELGKRVELGRKKAFRKHGIALASAPDGVVVELRGLSPVNEIELERHAAAAVIECNRRLLPDGEVGHRLHRILDRLA